MLSVVAAIEPLRVANRMAGQTAYDWRVVAEAGATIRASNGLVLENGAQLGSGGVPDYCFVCAGLGLEAANQTRLSAFLSRRFAAGVTMGAISMGTIFLARAGLLTGKRATIHWEGKPAFHEEFPDIELSDAIYEIDGQIMTCAGGMSSFDLMMEIIAREHETWLVHSVANQLQLDRIRNNLVMQSHGSALLDETAPQQIRKAVTLIAENMEHPIPPDDLASAVGASRRKLERLFQKHLGMTPARYCKTRRLEQARDLLQHSNLSLIDVAIATGFRSGSYFSYSFSEFFGISPSTVRKTAEGGS